MIRSDLPSAAGIKGDHVSAIKGANDLIRAMCVCSAEEKVHKKIAFPHIVREIESKHGRRGLAAHIEEKDL